MPCFALLPQARIIVLRPSRQHERSWPPENQAEFGALTQAVGAELGAEGEEKQRLADEPLTPALSEHKNGGPAWTRRLETPALRSASRTDRRRHSSFGVRSDPFVLDQHCPSLQRELE